MQTRPFGECSAGPVRAFVLGSAPGPVLEVLDLGATVHRLWVTGGDGVRRNVVLGYATPEEYLAGSDYLGATVGRYANRIAGGCFPLDGEVVRLATNENGTTLHGGPDGFDRRVWDVVENGEDRLTLGLVSPDGDQGFPGQVTARARWEVAEETVRLVLTATTDAPTVVGLTSHAYVNLDGDSAGPAGGQVGAQLLAVQAEEYLPVDRAGIPLDPVAVAGTPFDLREPALLGPRIVETGGLDHCYVLPGSGVRPAATLDSPATRTRLVLSTDLPGLQVYAGGSLDGSGRSVTGHRYGPGDGLALEPQLLPDTPNRPDLGSAVLRPEELWSASLEWRFSAL